MSRDRRAQKCNPNRQAAELYMRLVDHALDPIGLGEPEAPRKPALDHVARAALQKGPRR